MGTEFRKVVCDEKGIGGDREYSGDNGAQLDRFTVFHYEASGGKPARCSSTSSASPLCELFCPGTLVNQNAGTGSNWAKAHYTKAGHKFKA
jgi:hypothetical protein